MSSRDIVFFFRGFRGLAAGWLSGLSGQTGEGRSGTGNGRQLSLLVASAQNNPQL